MAAVHKIPRSGGGPGPSRPQGGGYPQKADGLRQSGLRAPKKESGGKKVIKTEHKYGPAPVRTGNTPRWGARKLGR